MRRSTRVTTQSAERIRCATASLRSLATEFPLKLSTLWPPSAWRRMSFETFGAGTIIDCRNATPSPPYGTSPGSPDPRETGRHRASPTTRHLRATPATATLRASHYRPLGVRIPSVVRLPAPGLEFGCFQIAYGGLRCLDGRIVGIGTGASQGWSIRGRVRRLSGWIPRTGPTGIFTIQAVGHYGHSRGRDAPARGCRGRRQSRVLRHRRRWSHP